MGRLGGRLGVHPLAVEYRSLRRALELRHRAARDAHQRDTGWPVKRNVWERNRADRLPVRAQGGPPAHRAGLAARLDPLQSAARPRLRFLRWRHQDAPADVQPDSCFDEFRDARHRHHVPLLPHVAHRHPRGARRAVIPHRLACVVVLDARRVWVLPRLPAGDAHRPLRGRGGRGRRRRAHPGRVGCSLLARRDHLLYRHPLRVHGRRHPWRRCRAASA
mmetsp:Transcript_26075/g.69571  ORF Transcript_26075/g.69571 Transcript_26075/m.69571 type:complete len:219 (+) Transcript_26075:214-870(+)